MKIGELIKQLEQIQAKQGDVEVMFSGPNHDQSLYSVGIVEFRVAEENEFDEEWDMPEGTKFVSLYN